MNNIKYYPFERNKYFYGKLLTATDFETEQNYINNKRRFINRALFGAGIVAGLKVGSNDNVLMIESGFAIDYYGREILIEQAIMQKLSELSGYEETKDGVSYLCLEYYEKGTDKVYALKSQDNNVQDEYSRIKENYRLFLTNEYPILEERGESDFIHRNLIYEDEQVSVLIRTPHFAQVKESIKIYIDIFRLNINIPLELKLQIQTPYLINEQGEQYIDVIYNSSDENLQEETLSYILTVDKNHLPNTKITLLKEGIYIKVGNKIEEATKDYNMSISFINQSISTELKKRQEGLTFDRLMNVPAKSICLAKLYLLKMQNAYTITRIISNPFGQNAFTPFAAYQNTMILEYFSGQITKTIEKIIKPTPITPITSLEPVNNEERVSQGTVEIFFGAKAKSGRCYLSEEIPHGLGIGTVIVEVALEERGDIEEGTGKDSLIFGDMEVFKGSEHEFKMPPTRLGVRCYEKKGTFVVGAKLMETASVSSIKVRWFARKINLKKAIEKRGEQKIRLYIEPSSIVLKPREGIHLKICQDINLCNEDDIIDFNGNELIEWEVVEKDGGTITRMGYYTAPSQIGLYTVKATLISDNECYAHTIIIVK